MEVTHGDSRHFSAAGPQPGCFLGETYTNIPINSIFTNLSLVAPHARLWDSYPILRESAAEMGRPYAPVRLSVHLYPCVCIH